MAWSPEARAAAAEARRRKSKQHVLLGKGRSVSRSDLARGIRDARKGLAGDPIYKRGAKWRATQARAIAISVASHKAGGKTSSAYLQRYQMTKGRGRR